MLWKSIQRHHLNAYFAPIFFFFLFPNLFTSSHVNHVLQIIRLINLLILYLIIKFWNHARLKQFIQSRPMSSTVLLWNLDNDTLHFSVSFQSIFSQLTSISRHLKSTKRHMSVHYIIAVHPMNKFKCKLILTFFQVQETHYTTTNTIFIWRIYLNIRHLWI